MYNPFQNVRKVRISPTIRRPLDGGVIPPTPKGETARAGVSIKGMLARAGISGMTVKVRETPKRAATIHPVREERAETERFVSEEVAVEEVSVDNPPSVVKETVCETGMSETEGRLADYLGAAEEAVEKADAASEEKPLESQPSEWRKRKRKHGKGRR